MLKQAEKNRVESLLGQFGCNSSEVAIYLQCLQIPPATVQEIARRLKRNRVTVHSSIEQLIDKGFLYETIKGKKRLIAAESPETLPHLLQKKENELNLIKGNLAYVVKLLESVKPYDQSRPTVKFYEGVDGLKKMLEETLVTKGEVLVFSYVEFLADLVGHDYLENYVSRRAKKNIHSRLIFPPCSFANRIMRKTTEYKAQVRLLSPGFMWKSGIFLWDNSLSLLSYTEQKVTCTIIENPDIAYFFRNIIFELMWGSLKPHP